MAHIMVPEIMTEADILLLETSHIEVLSVSMHGTLAVSIMFFWMILALRMLWESPKLQDLPSCHMKIPKASLLGST